jgi:acetylglutamate kinase
MPVPDLSAEAFAHAVDRVAQHRERPVVVKLGGSAMEDPAATDSCLRSVAVLHRLGVWIALVHGGGKPIDRAMADAGLVPRKVAGRRYTDDATLEIVVRTLCEISRDLQERLWSLKVPGPNPFHVELVKNWPLRGTRLTLLDSEGNDVDLGHVGRVTEVSRSVRDYFPAGFVPILPSLAQDASGNWLNINADTAASAVAGAIGAEKVIFLSDIPGVLRDRRDPASLIPKLTEAECRSLIAEGVIEGGMVPKVEACFEALAAGAKSAFILDGREPFSLLRVFLHDSFPGTEITQ